MIQGNGSIVGFDSINNQGTILASGGDKYIDLALLVNNGYLKAENNSTLKIAGPLSNNGKVEAIGTGRVLISEPSLYAFGSSINNVTFSIDTVTLTGGQSLDQFAVFNNQQDGSLTLSNGDLFDAASFQNVATDNLANGTLKGLQNNVGGLVQGYGNIELSSALSANSSEYVNNGTIRAQDGTLRLNVFASSGNFINKGTVEVLGGSNLVFRMDTPATGSLSSGHIFYWEWRHLGCLCRRPSCDYSIYSNRVDGGSQCIKNLTNLELIHRAKKPVSTPII
jgi:hypothetical protein